jgi:hypothetical protein
MTWRAIPVPGFCYYEFAINAQNQCVGAVTRKNKSEKYNAFYCDGKKIVKGYCWSFRNARKIVTDAAV